MVATLRIGLDVQDYDMWRTAFGKDAGGRARHGAAQHRIFRAADDPNAVTLDIDFPTTAAANEFLEVLRTDVWPSPEKSPAKIGTPDARVLELQEISSDEYR